MTYINEIEFTPTANLTCESNSSALWGPSFPDYREGDLGERGRFQNIQVYVHYSAPNGKKKSLKKIGLRSDITYPRNELHPSNLIH